MQRLLSNTILERPIANALSMQDSVLSVHAAWLTLPQWNHPDAGPPFKPHIQHQSCMKQVHVFNVLARLQGT